MNFLPLLEAKRDGTALTQPQIQEIIASVVSGEIPDYQLAAFLMAVYFRGLDTAETRALTLAMRDSGETLQFPADGRPIVDKHSTGGVGDKISLPLAPLLICLGLRVPMISGRGLGITGGTLDKLESIPGYTTTQTRERILEVVDTVGGCIVAQSKNMVPADRIIYGLRDVTATVPSIQLITASILSKKLAEGLDALILDVKWGKAAFMTSKADAEKLGMAMCELGTACGTPTQAFLCDMNVPLGRTAGNWLEVMESVETLEGNGPDDIHKLTLECAARLLVMTGKSANFEEGRVVAQKCLDSGAPREKWNEMLVAQGTDLAAFEAKLKAPVPAFAFEIKAPAGGTIQDLDARIVGEVVRDLGGGRLHKDSVLNLEVGVAKMKKPGETIAAGEPLALLYAASEANAKGVEERLRGAWIVGDGGFASKPLVEELLS